MKYLILSALVYFAPQVLAESDYAEEANDTVMETDGAPELIKNRQSFASFMGMTAKEVSFGEPRNFRAESLNNLQLDPLNEAE